MQAALKLKTTVLPGNRIEFSAPELPEGAEVEVFIALPETTTTPAEPPRLFKDVMEFLDSLPPIPRTPEEWAQIEREFQEERDAWER